MAAIGHDPDSLQASYLGPQVPIGISRKCLPYSCGLAPSYVPSCLFKPDAVVSRPVEQLAIRPLVTDELWKKLSADLKNHAENRIQLFLQQMLLVYKTKLCFELYPHADMQVGQVPTKKRQTGPTYVGAHDGTLPTLRLHPSETKDTSISFAKDTTFYNNWNATIYLPELANQLDSAIDRSTIAANGNRSFREIATNILNQVATGELTPKQGLDDFLATLIQAIESIESRTEERQIILQKYAKVAHRYQDLAESNGFIQRFCLRPRNAALEELFYMDVQAEMFETLQCELKAPAATQMPELPETIDLAVLQRAIADKIPTPPTSTAQAYIKLCLTTESVRAVAMRYFIYLNSLTSEEVEGDLTQILQIKPKPTGLSQTAEELYWAARAVIRSQVENPQNMHLILLSLLLQMSLNQQVEPPQLAEEAKEQCRELIKAKIEAKKLKLTAKTATYIQLCAKTKKVSDAANALFAEIASVQTSCQEKELNKLFQIRKASIGNAGLSEKALTFYTAALQTIQEAHNIQQPRNMPLILCRLLID